MTQLYQWLLERATSLHSKTSGWSRGRTLRTEVTVEQHEQLLLLCRHGMNPGTACPLCGHVLLAASPQPHPSISATDGPLSAAGSTGPARSGSPKLKAIPRRSR